MNFFPQLNRQAKESHGRRRAHIYTGPHIRGHNNTAPLCVSSGAPGHVKTMTTVIGYVRVSTSEQGLTGYGLDAQRSAITGECERRGWTLLRIESDVASGASTRRRPGLAQALLSCDAGEAGALVAPLGRRRAAPPAVVCPRSAERRRQPPPGEQPVRPRTPTRWSGAPTARHRWRQRSRGRTAAPRMRTRRSPARRGARPCACAAAVPLPWRQWQGARRRISSRPLRG